MLLLYIMFAEEGKAESGSSVRCNQMLNSFKKMDIELKVISGRTDEIKKRQQNAKMLLRWLKYNRPDFCYIEPPSGPFFCKEDLKVLKKLQKLKIPTSLFYRDAYWMFPDLFFTSKTIYEKAKQLIIKKMQQRDLKIFQNCCQHIFFPSTEMAVLFPFKSFSSLPPGCELYECNESLYYITKNIIYIGGANEHYGTYLLLDAVKKLNEQNKNVNLIYICPESNWARLPNIYKAYEREEWLRVEHIYGIENLIKAYQQADIAIIPRIKNEYLDFAMPIKLFEYLSFLKPIISTNCLSTANFIKKNNIGIVCEDNIESLSDSIWKLLNDPVLYAELKSNCIKVRKVNTWNNRTQEVINTLLNIPSINNGI